VAKLNLERNTFVKGLITEASPLTFPENASIAEDNFVLNRDGSRQRRRGMDYEDGFVKLGVGLDFTGFASTAITGFRWENVDNDPTKTLGVIQIGYKFVFVDGFKDTLSANIKGELAITSFAAQHQTQFATIDGKLIAVNPAFRLPKLISFVGGVFTETDISLVVRDIWGVTDGLELDERQKPITIQHEYNLFNQGWPTKKVDVGASLEYPHANHSSQFPANNEIWFIAKNASEDYDFNLLDSRVFGTRPAPKGRILLDAFARGATRRTFMTDNYSTTIADSAVKSLHPLPDGASASVTELPLDAELSSVTAVASYAGRIFYSGVDSEVSEGDDNTPIYSSTIFFSQVVQNNNDLGKCHTVNDPTSEDFNETLATDGGTFTIPEASRVLRLVNKDTSLVVVAENGIWEVTGPDGVFRADDFSIRQITNIGVTNAQSVVDVEGSLYYWSKAGIYVLSAQDATGRLAAQNITETTIQTLYTEIPSVGRSNAVSRYDSDSRKVSWLYNDSEDYDGIRQKHKYNKELVLDLTLGAFSTNTFGTLETDSSYIAGYLPTGGFSVIKDQQPVTVNGQEVQVNGETVVISKDARTKGRSSTKYLTIKPNSVGDVEFTFSLYKDVNFIDWISDDGVGVDAAAYLITGYELFNDSARRKQIPYLTMHFRQTETEMIASGSDFVPDFPSACLVQSQWDFSNHSNSGKFGSQIQAYKLHKHFGVEEGVFNYGKSVVTTKNRLRGSGRAFSMRVDTEAGKDLHLYGWALHIEGSENV